MKELEIKLLSESATIPTRGHYTDSGLDLYTSEDVTINDTETVLVPTGIAINLPPGYEAQVRPRSGRTLEGMFLVNLGTVDEGYQGEIKIITTLRIPESEEVLNNIRLNRVRTIPAGTKLAQLVVQPVVRPQVKLVNDFGKGTERGSNGFGSTGN